MHGAIYPKTAELGEPCEARDRAAALIADAGRDETGMQAVGGDPRALQAAGEFAREENVAKLGAAIGFHGSEALRRLQVVDARPKLC